MGNSGVEIAIIGGGLSGLVLALALHEQSVKCAIYESRSEPANVGGALMLAPNGLKALAKLGLYDEVSKLGYNFDHTYFQDGASGRILETMVYDDMERHGVRGLRIYRKAILNDLLARVTAAAIPVHYGKKFSHVVEEREDGATWAFTDGSTASASFLVGTDGIHSAVRRYLAPDIEPVFSSGLAIACAVPTAQLQLPEHDLINLNSATNTHPLPCGIVSPGHGAYVFAPQTFSGDEVLVAIQAPVDEATRNKIMDVSAGKDHLKALLRQRAEHFPAIVQNAVREIDDETILTWPFYNLPRLEDWTSANLGSGFGRVIIMGDSAHAFPPSAGQGANVAFEDVYTFARVLGRLLNSDYASSSAELKMGLSKWQRSRQARVDDVLEVNHQMDLRRMPKAAGAGDAEAKKLDLPALFRGLFDIDFDKEVEDCLRP